MSKVRSPLVTCGAILTVIGGIIADHGTQTAGAASGAGPASGAVYSDTAIAGFALVALGIALIFIGVVRTVRA